MFINEDRLYIFLQDNVREEAVWAWLYPNTRFELLHDNTVAYTEFWLAASSSSGYMAFNFNLECRGFPARTTDGRTDDNNGSVRVSGSGIQSSVRCRRVRPSVLVCDRAEDDFGGKFMSGVFLPLSLTLTLTVFSTCSS